jgi:PIF1-like helicase
VKGLVGSQKDAYIYTAAGSHVVVKGTGGAGKTHLARVIMNDFTQKYGSESFIAVAQTHNAAIVLGGQTLNSVHHLGILDPAEIYQYVHQVGSEEEKNRRVKEFVEKYFADDSSKRRIRIARLLILDEFGRISKDLFEFLDRLYRIIREEESKPFGGIQLLILGDPTQCNTSEFEDYKEWCAENGREFNAEQFEFCFLSKLFASCELTWFSLARSKNFRLDEPWADVGLRARRGELAETGT